MHSASYCCNDISFITQDIDNASASGVWSRALTPFNQVMDLRVESCNSVEDNGAIYIHRVNNYKEYTHNGHASNAIRVNKIPKSQPIFNSIALSFSDTEPTL